MPAPTPLRFERTPSALRYMAHALRPRRGGELPALDACWHGAVAAPALRADFERLTGLACAPALPLPFVHAWSFRLQMALLTHPAFPLPIWQALQLRNRLRQHRPLAPGARVDMRTRVAAQRRLDKGLEVDLHTTLADADGVAWEGTTTFYYRGRRRGDDPVPAQAAAPRVDAPPQSLADMPHDGGWRFGRVSGDYNGLHWSDAWARRFGFAGAFHHPPRAIAIAMARLALPLHAPAQRLDAWIRGPLRYGSALSLARADEATGATRFALFGSDDARPAIVARWAPDDAGVVD